LNIEVDDIRESLGNNGRHVSLDTPLTEDDDSSLLDTLENHNADRTDSALYHVESLKREIARSLQVLNEKQRLTICYLFGIGLDHPMSMEDIAQKFDLTLERVRQIKEKALEKLRKTGNFNALRGYLGG
jgi:RNA polymerase primary sigma factor